MTTQRIECPSCREEITVHLGDHNTIHVCRCGERLEVSVRRRRRFGRIASPGKSGALVAGWQDG